MTADAWKKYNAFPLALGNKQVDMDADTFVMALFTSTMVPNAVTQSALADIVANELTGNGYARQTLTNPSWSESAGTVTWDVDDAVFTASGGNIVGRYAVIFDDSTLTGAPVVDLLMCYSLLDNTPADITITDGTSTTIGVANVFTESGM